MVGGFITESSDREGAEIFFGSKNIFVFVAKWALILAY